MMMNEPHIRIVLIDAGIVLRILLVFTIAVSLKLRRSS